MKGDRIMRHSDYVFEVAGTLLHIMSDAVIVAGALAALYLIFV